MKELIEYLIIGIVQGISEVLPISSSAHLVLVQELMGINDDNLTLEVFLHLASLVAILFFLRRRLIKLISGFLKYLFRKEKDNYQEFKIFVYLIISTIPVVLITLLFKEYINIIGSNILIIGILLIINGLFLLIFNNVEGYKTLKDMKVLDALIIGLFECMGLFPGISRSGSCIYGASNRKIEKEASSEYAFLLFIPAILGATVLELKNFKQIIVGSDIWLYLITFIVTSIVTYLTFILLLKIIKKGNLKYFGYYCIMVGVISVVFKMLQFT